MIISKDYLPFEQNKDMPKEKNTIQKLIPVVIGGVVGVVIGYFGAEYFMTDLKEFIASAPNLLVAILLGVLAFFLVILIHELGHLAGGLLMGNEFSFLSVGPFKIQKEDGQYNFQFLKDIPALGLALSLPTKVEGFKMRRLVTISGGPLASLLLAIGSILLASIAAPFFLKLLGGMSAFIFLMTAIPAKAGGMLTDGMQIVMTLRNDEKGKQYGDFMHLFALDQKGTLPKDYPMAFMTPYEKEELEDIYDIGFSQRFYHKALDEGNQENAKKYISQLEENYTLYPPVFHIELLAEVACYYSFHQPDKERFQSVIDKANGKVPKMSQLFSNYYQAAIAHARGDQQQTAALLEKVVASTKKDGISKMYRRFAKELLEKE